MKKILPLFYVCLLSLLPFEGFSQNFRIGFMPSFAIPTGDFGTINKNGYGFGLTSKYTIPKKIDENTSEQSRWTFTTSLQFLAFGKAGENLAEYAKTLGLKDGTIEILNLYNLTSPESEQIKVPNVDFYPINIGVEFSILKNKKIRPYVSWDFGVYVRRSDNIDINIGKLIAKYYELQGGIPGNVQPLQAALATTTLSLNSNSVDYGAAPGVGCAYNFNKRWSVDFSFKAHTVWVPDKKAGAIILGAQLGGFYSF